jgi:hypothetical protein
LRCAGIHRLVMMVKSHDADVAKSLRRGATGPGSTPVGKNWKWSVG